MKQIDFTKIEKKWQKAWESKKIFEVKENKKKKFYVLDMFPYPSGEGLHIGHAFVFTLGDIFARFKRMQGFNVLYPVGYDSLGLPAENAAIKVGIHPAKYTEKSIANFMKQQKAMGWSYDWSRMVKTSDPDFYKWDQWIFLKMLEKGIVYKKKAPVNWCPKCRTVLANEQCVNGKCWRHEDTNVEIKHLEQWFFKITNYSEELLEGLEKLDWPENAKRMQRNWIGKSYGTEIDFEIESKISNVVIVHGSNSKDRENIKKYNLPPQNERGWFGWIKSELETRGVNVFTPLMPENWNPKYENWKKEIEKITIDESSVLVGTSSGGAFLTRWLGETKIKIKKLILVAPACRNKKKEGWELEEFYDFEIDKNILDKVSEVILIESSNDSESIKESCQIYSKVFGINSIVLKNRGHFTQRGTKDNMEFPELLNTITSNEKWLIFTTRPDTIFGVTFMVVSAQHLRLMELVTSKEKKNVEKFLKKLKSVSEKELESMEKEGVFTGAYAINPINNEKVPVYAGNFVVADYGCGIVMAVPAHDQRDFEFAKKYGIEIRQVIKPERTSIVTITESLKKEFYEGAKKFGDVVENDGLSKIYTEEVDKVFELAKGNFVGAPWYIHSEGKIKKVLMHSSKDDKIFNWGNKKENSDAKKFGLNIGIKNEQLDYDELYQAYTDNGELINSGEFDGLESKEAKEKITKYLAKKKLGRKAVNFKLRDWLISRQRYWGTPIPIIYCDDCRAVPVPEKDLPVKLPDKVKFGKGNPLETAESWIKAKCPKCGGEGKREIDTMDTFVNSSWYYLRYTDPKNNKKIFDEKKANYWAPIDQYIGGPEHITMHLIYARFYTKFLRDIGLLKFDEPALRYFTQGIIHGSDGEKMSKSRGNVVEPLEMIEKFGADSLRLYLVSNSSPDSSSNWDSKGINGSSKFVRNVYHYFVDFKAGKTNRKIESKLNKTIKEVEGYVFEFKHNLAVIKIRELFNSFSNEKIDKKSAESFLKLLHIYCPFVTEELWQKIGGNGFISLADWPVADEKKIDEKLEKEDEMVGKLLGDINQIKKLTGKTGKVYVYVLPQEKEIYKDVADIELFAVNDKNKHDPENKSKKVKPGRPGIYLE